VRRGNGQPEPLSGHLLRLPGGLPAAAAGAADRGLGVVHPVRRLPDSGRRRHVAGAAGGALALNARILLVKSDSCAPCPPNF
jgi:hypothetical protein